MHGLAPAQPPDMRSNQRRCSPVLAGILLTLGGCAATLEVRTLATGRSDVSAYEINGADLDLLRREAQRLCPLGGEIVRQFGQQQRPEVTGGRWRSALNSGAAWVDPPRQSAQLVLLCREPGGHFQWPAQVAAPPQPAASRATVSAAEVAAALPVGPITPEW